MRQRSARPRGLTTIALGALLALPVMLILPVDSASATGMGGGDDRDPAVIAQSAEAWGDNRIGQLGDATSTDRHTAVTVAGPDGVRAVSAGHFHNLALLSNGTVKAWGDNFFGQLGDGTSGSDTTRLTPGTVAGLAKVTAVAAGDDHSLALLSNGTVKAWGDNRRGQLGNNTTTASSRPVDVVGLTGLKVTAIAAGADFSLALISDGTVRAWGDNRTGQLGNGTTSPNPQPTPVSVALAGIRVKTISAGEDHALAVVPGGAVKAWGRNEFGQLGNGNTTTQPTPVNVINLTGTRVKSVAAGASFSLALLTSGRVKAWGNNHFGQLGNGNTTDQHTPVDTVDLTGVTAIAASRGAAYGGTPVAGPTTEADVEISAHSLAISGHTIKAWGYNQYGQLGDGSTTNSSRPVIVRTGLGHPHSISAGYLHSVAS